MHKLKVTQVKKLSLPKHTQTEPIFCGFNIDHTQGYKRNLPHLRIEGATYFVTFRLADSIPETVMTQWLEERNLWLQELGIDPKLQKFDNNRFRQLYDAIPMLEKIKYERKRLNRYFKELDECHGDCILLEYKQIMASSIEFFHGKRIWVGDYVVMPNHVHLIVQPFKGIRLEEWLYSIKRCTAKKINVEIANEGANLATCYKKMWQEESYDRVIRNCNELARTRKYIANNPVNLRENSYLLKQMLWLDQFSPSFKL